MKTVNPWITYRTRFLVKARQINASLTFTDVLGRQHSGRKGDYLVESSDGVLRIAPRQIFEDIYVPLAEGQAETSDFSAPLPQYSDGDKACAEGPGPDQLFPRALAARRKNATILLPPQLSRKSPQPARDRRHSSPGIRSL